jgi:hypothetical protein
MNGTDPSRSKSLLQLSDEVVGGLVKGRLIREGGIIHKAAAGFGAADKVVAWIRETHGEPLPAASLAGLGGASWLASFLTPASSYLCLGATVGFGVAALRRLASIDSRLQEVNARLERLQWAVDMGFYHVSRKLDNIVELLTTILGRLELERFDRIRAATEQAQLAQFISPGDQQRKTMLANALHDAINASTGLPAQTEIRVEEAIKKLNRTRDRSRFNCLDVLTLALLHVRQACAIFAMRAAVEAEAVSPSAAVYSLKNTVDALDILLNRLASAFLQGPEGQPRCFNYDYLLEGKWVAILSPSRIERWVKRLDPNLGGLSGMLDVLRKTGGRVSLARLNSQPVMRGAIWSKLHSVAEHLDGAWEDIDRLRAHMIEYSDAARQSLSIQEYREMFALHSEEEVPTEASLVCFEQADLARSRQVPSSRRRPHRRGSPTEGR